MTAAELAPATATLPAVAAPRERERDRPAATATGQRLAFGVAAFTLVLVGVWLVAAPRTPDLAAQVYRAALFHQLGFAVWDSRWYGGHSLPGYSLLYPPLASLLGMRALGALCVLASTALFVCLVRPLFGDRAALWGAAWFAAAALGDVWIGRLTFALGVSLALAAGVALSRRRWLLAALLAALCAAASPVAGALLGLAGLSVALAQRKPRALLTLALPAGAVVLALAVLFPEGGGTEPYPLLSFLATAAVVGAFVWALPRSQRLLRVGALVYLAACVACLAIKSPIGSNIERYAVLLAGPLLLCALLAERDREAGRGGGAVLDVDAASMPAADADRALRAGASPGGVALWPWRRIGPLAAGALALIGAWVAWGPLRETLAVAGGDSTSAAYYAPVKRFLAGERARGPVRVEVPLTRSHWEAAMLAPTVSLARGWEKQLETRYDGVLLAAGLNAASYERWLRAQAVTYVALPDTRLDPSSAQEGRLVRAGLPYLHEVFASRHWRVFEVLGATPLASGPGRLLAMGHDSFALDARSAGTFLVRVHFSRFWTLASGSGCVSPARDGWTRVSVARAGVAVVAARFSLSRAFGDDGSCSAGAAA